MRKSSTIARTLAVPARKIACQVQRMILCMSAPHIVTCEYTCIRQLTPGLRRPASQLLHRRHWGENALVFRNWTLEYQVLNETKENQLSLSKMLQNHNSQISYFH